MAHGYLPNRIVDLYREAYTDNAGTGIFTTYTDVQRELRGELDSSITAPAKGDSWLTRLKHFLLGVS